MVFIPAAALRIVERSVRCIPLHRNFTPLSCSSGSASCPRAEGRTLKVRHPWKNAFLLMLESEKSLYNHFSSCNQSSDRFIFFQVWHKNSCRKPGVHHHAKNHQYKYINIYQCLLALWVALICHHENYMCIGVNAHLYLLKAYG